MQGSLSWSVIGLLVRLGLGYTVDVTSVSAEGLRAVRYAKAVVTRSEPVANGNDVNALIQGDVNEIKQTAKPLCRPHHKLRRLMLQREEQHIDHDVVNKPTFSGLLCHVRHPSTSSNDVKVFSRRLRDGSTCDEHAQSMNSTDDITSLRANLESKQCMDAGTDSLLRRVTNLLQLQNDELQLRSNSRRLMRLQCRLNRKLISCDQRREIEARDNDALTPAEIYFLNHWPTSDDVKDASQLEMIFY